VEVVASLSQGHTAAAQCCLFTYKSVPVIFEPPYTYIYIYICTCIYRFQTVFIRCPTPRLYCSLSSHWPSFRFLSFMAFFIPSTQFFFGLPRALFCFGIHFNAILGNLPSAIICSKNKHSLHSCVSMKTVIGRLTTLLCQYENSHWVSHNTPVLVCRRSLGVSLHSFVSTGRVIGCLTTLLCQYVDDH